MGSASGTRRETDLSPMWKRIIVMAIVLTGAVFFWKVLLGLAAVLVLIVVVPFFLERWQRRRAVHKFRKCWQSQGKDVLLVYSNSPVWQAYIETNWLPKFGHRAVVLNWSERKNWQVTKRPEVALFYVFSGHREFNPLAIVVPQRGHSVQIIRFWRAFREFKHGKDRLLLAAETELLARLSSG